MNRKPPREFEDELLFPQKMNPTLTKENTREEEVVNMSPVTDNFIDNFQRTPIVSIKLPPKEVREEKTVETLKEELRELNNAELEIPSVDLASPDTYKSIPRLDHLTPLPPEPTPEPEPAKAKPEASEPKASDASRERSEQGKLLGATLGAAALSTAKLGGKVISTGVDLTARTGKKVLGMDRKFDNLPNKMSAPNYDNIVYPTQPKRKSKYKQKPSFATIDNFFLEPEEQEVTSKYNLEELEKKKREEEELDRQLRQQMKIYEEQKQSARNTVYDFDDYVLADFEQETDIAEDVVSKYEDEAPEPVTEPPQDAIEVEIDLDYNLQNEIEDLLLKLLQTKKNEEKEILLHDHNGDLADKVAKNAKVTNILHSTSPDDLADDSEDEVEQQAYEILTRSEKVCDLEQFLEFTTWLQTFMEDCKWDNYLSLHVINLLISLEGKIIKANNISISKTADVMAKYTDACPDNLEDEHFLKIIDKVFDEYLEELNTQESKYVPDTMGFSFCDFCSTLADCLANIIISVTNNEESDEE